MCALYLNTATVDFNQHSYGYTVTTVEEYFTHTYLEGLFNIRCPLRCKFSYSNFNCLPKFKDECISTDHITISALPFAGTKKEIKREYILKEESLWNNADALHIVYLLINKHINTLLQKNRGSWTAFSAHKHEYNTQLVKLYTAGVLGGWDEEDTQQYLSRHMDSLLTPLYQSVVGTGGGAKFCARYDYLGTLYSTRQKKDKDIKDGDIHLALKGMLQKVSSFEEATQKVTWFTNLTAKIIFECWLERYGKDQYRQSNTICTLL